jgi:uncharacterized CHY-type Zn-finger protein
VQKNLSLLLKGSLVDEQTRCTHYHSPVDIIAIRMKCCGEYYACIHCHEELADHPAMQWRKEEREINAVLCGNCKNEMSINEYLHCDSQCPNCKSAFNPKCSNHNHFYFE